MASDSDLALRRVPSLVSYCQRGEQPPPRPPRPILTRLPVLSAHADGMPSPPPRPRPHHPNSYNLSW